ncbi:MAG: PDZ domain-containing protein [Firmicutes bacterium]|nr:PDZ domain-containing protein [Bacillota bacterium]
MNLENNGDFSRQYRRSRRTAPVWMLFVIGFCGVLAGALVTCFLLEGMPPSPAGDSPQPPSAAGEAPAELPPPHEEDLAVVEVVSRVMPAVVAVNSYVPGSYFGRSVLMQSGSGSGVIIAEDGYIITNQHVIDGAEQIIVLTADSRSFEATVVGEDQLTDLALLKIEEKALPHASLGDSGTVRAGETVLAAGNPLGFLKHTVTRGIVSALEREVRASQSQYAYTYIQTDAVINRGNSGGPLVNLRGEVVGINSAKISEAEGIGLAIPSNTVKRVADDLREDGRVRRPQMGILIQNLSAHTGDSTDQGVHISEVNPGSPAVAGGLQVGDVIVAVGSREVRYIAQLFDALLSYYPGDTVELTVMRNGRSRTVTVVPGEAEAEQ